MGLYMLQMLMLISLLFMGTSYLYFFIYFYVIVLFRIVRAVRGMLRLGRDNGVGGLEMMIKIIVVAIYVTGGSRTI